MYRNPIIKGFNPDPSICKKDDTYYLVVSTFEYFPGATIYKSRDLVNWEYAASALNTVENLNLKNCLNSKGGIYAVTIRYHEGKFYIITTNKNIGWNFLIYADDISGPWSEPRLIRKKGIDPSIFFDDDGSCFYTSNGEVNGEKGILGAYIDPATGKFLSEERILTQGITGHATEAPHIYKENGYYYLIFAEGGTGSGHHEEVMRSTSLSGEWEYSGRPMLSHVPRKDYVIQATGHADLLKLDDGSWIAVFLGVRKANKPGLHQLGRETFLAPVTWENGWPMVGNDGYVDVEMDYDFGEQRKSDVFTLDFSRPLSEYPILKLREPKYSSYIQDCDGKMLTLLGDVPLSTERGTPTLIGIRQTDFYSTFKATMSIDSLSGKAGIAAWYSNYYYYRISIEHYDEQKIKVSLDLRVHGFEASKKTILIEKTGAVELEIRTEKDSYSFYVDSIFLGSASYAGLCTEAMMEMTFTGTLFAIWSENGSATFIDKLERRMTKELDITMSNK